MSYTKRQFVTEAYAELAFAEYVFDMGPEGLQTGLRILDRMMAEWDAEGVRCRYPLPDSPQDSNLDTETNVFDGANSAIVTNLALRLAKTRGKVPTPEMKIDASRAKKTLIKFLVRVPQMHLTPNTPVGAGYKTWRQGIVSPFFRDGHCEDSCDDDD